MHRLSSGKGLLVGLAAAGMLCAAPVTAPAQHCNAGPNCLGVNCNECRWRGGGSPMQCLYVFGSAYCGCGFDIHLGNNFGYGCYGVGD